MLLGFQNVFSILPHTVFWLLPGAYVLFQFFKKEEIDFITFAVCLLIYFSRKIQILSFATGQVPGIRLRWRSGYMILLESSGDQQL